MEPIDAIVSLRNSFSSKRIPPPPPPRRDKPENYGVHVLNLVADRRLAENIRLFAAKEFVSYLKTAATSIKESEVKVMKSRIGPAILFSTSSTIRSCLIEALCVMINTEFVHRLKRFVPEIMSSMKIAAVDNDNMKIVYILDAVNVLFNKLKQHFNLVLESRIPRPSSLRQIRINVDKRLLILISKSLQERKKKSRRSGRENLIRAAEKPKYAVNLLGVVAAPTVSQPIRRLAAANLTSHFKTRYVPLSVAPIDDGQIKTIKNLIIPVMVSSSPQIYDYLQEVVGVIIDTDFRVLLMKILTEVRSIIMRASEAIATLSVTTEEIAFVNGIAYAVSSFFDKVDEQLKMIFTQRPIPQLPPFALETIFSKLGADELARCMAVSKEWQTTTRSDRYWKPVCLERWPSLSRKNLPSSLYYKICSSKSCLEKTEITPMAAMEDLQDLTFFIDVQAPDGSSLIAKVIKGVDFENSLGVLDAVNEFNPYLNEYLEEDAQPYKLATVLSTSIIVSLSEITDIHLSFMVVRSRSNSTKMACIAEKNFQALDNDYRIFTSFRMGDLADLSCTGEFSLICNGEEDDDVLKVFGLEFHIEDMTKEGFLQRLGCLQWK